MNTHVRDNLNAVWRLVDYVEYTGNVSVTATSEGTANTIVTGTSQAYAATPYMVEFSCPRFLASAPNLLHITGFAGATVLGDMGQFITAGTTEDDMLLHRRHTPSASTFSFIVKGWTAAGTATIKAGAGGTGALVPGYIAVYSSAAVGAP